MRPSMMSIVGCGASRRTSYDRLDQRCTGMEFATEMIIKASLFGEKIGEVPITLHPDGRKSHAPHLQTFRDGWRTLRFFLMYSPRWLFLIPGALLILLGLLGYGLAMPGLTLWGMTFDVHTLLFASLGILCGYQSILFAIFTKAFAISEGLLPEDQAPDSVFRARQSRERAAHGISGTAHWHCAPAGSGESMAISQLRKSGLCSNHAFRVPGVTLTALGFQTILSSFFVSILGMRRK